MADDREERRERKTKPRTPDDVDVQVYHPRGGGGGGTPYRGDPYNGQVNPGYEYSTPRKSTTGSVTDYPHIHPTNPIYTSSTLPSVKSSQSRISAATATTTATSATTRRFKRDPTAPKRPYDWRWLAALAILMFFPTGIFAMAFSIKARNKFHAGFIRESYLLNKKAFILVIVSVICGVAWLVGLFFGVDRWPRNNG